LSRRSGIIGRLRQRRNDIGAGAAADELLGTRRFVARRAVGGIRAERIACLRDGLVG
jgi:hypothetical protein